jgi:3',5'-cyclic AMP phosphodiesterase CpdA
VVVTGDVSNLALEREFDGVSDLLDTLAADLAAKKTGALASDLVSVVPGNHDAYTRGAVRAGRFRAWFGRYMTSELAAEEGAFPYVRLRGPVALIGLSSAVARPPLVASGELGRAQLARLAELLRHPDVRDRTPVILQHHPIHNPRSSMRMLLEGLLDAAEEQRLLGAIARGLVLHGHLHERIHRTLDTASGRLSAVGATSASLLDERPERMAGFNVYEIGSNGAIREIAAERFTGRGGGFESAHVPAA